MYLHECVLALLPIKLCLQHDILDGVVAWRGQVCDRSTRLGRQHHVMLDEVVLRDQSVHVAARDVAANAQLARLELPLLSDGQGGGVDTLQCTANDNRPNSNNRKYKIIVPSIPAPWVCRLIV